MSRPRAARGGANNTVSLHYKECLTRGNTSAHQIPNTAAFLTRYLSYFCPIYCLRLPFHVPSYTTSLFPVPPSRVNTATHQLCNTAIFSLDICLISALSSGCVFSSLSFRFYTPSLFAMPYTGDIEAHQRHSTTASLSPIFFFPFSYLHRASRLPDLLISDPFFTFFSPFLSTDS